MAKKKSTKSSQRRSANPLGLPSWVLGALGAIVLLLLGGAWSAIRQSEPASIFVNSQPVSAESLQLGQTIYAENCASCHGENLEGQPEWKIPNHDGVMKAPPHDENGHTWHHDDNYLLERIRNGTESLDAVTQNQSDMPAYDMLLTDEEIESVLAYIKSTWSPRIQEIQAQR